MSPKESILAAGLDLARRFARAAKMGHQPLDALTNYLHLHHQTLLEVALQRRPLRLQDNNFLQVLVETGNVRFGRTEALLVRDCEVPVELNEKGDRLHACAFENIDGGRSAPDSRRQLFQSLAHFHERIRGGGSTVL